MSTNTRRLLSIDNNPRILWNLVEGASSYKLSISRKHDKKTLWEMEVNNFEKVEYPTGSGSYFGVIDYPTPGTQYPRLKQNEIYLLTGATNNGTYDLDTTVEIMLLRTSVLKSIEELKVEISKDPESVIVQNLSSAVEDILIPPFKNISSLPRWYPFFLTCASIEFEIDF
jgi:hypothetical protein